MKFSLRFQKDEVKGASDMTSWMERTGGSQCIFTAVGLYIVNDVYLSSRVFENRVIFSRVACLLLKRVLVQKNSVGCWSFAWLSLVDAFAKLRKTVVSFVVSVHPPVRMGHLGSHRTDFNEIGYLNICRKSIENIQVWLKYGTNIGYFTGITMHIFDHISLISY